MMIRTVTKALVRCILLTLPTNTSFSAERFRLAALSKASCILEPVRQERPVGLHPALFPVTSVPAQTKCCQAEIGPIGLHIPVLRAV